MIPVRAILALICFSTSLLFEPTPWVAQDRERSSAASSPAIDSARRRWENFSAEEKARTRSRYERFLALSEEEREQLAESAARLRERSDRIVAELARSSVAGEGALDPSQRRALVRDIVAEESRAIGARIRGQLPENIIRRLENARPEDRARFFQEFRLQQRNRVARYAIGDLGKRLGLAPEEIQRLQILPGDERGQALLDLRKRLSAQEVQESGLPPGLTREAWEAWLELPPEEFFDAFQRYREARIFARAKTARAKREEALQELFEVTRPRPEDVLALSALPPEERRATLALERRARCTRALRAGELLTREQLDALDARSDAEFFGIVRRLLSKSAGPHWTRGPGEDASRR